MWIQTRFFIMCLIYRSVMYVCQTVCDLCGEGLVLWSGWEHQTLPKSILDRPSLLLLLLEITEWCLKKKKKDKSFGPVSSPKALPFRPSHSRFDWEEGSIRLRSHWSELQPVIHSLLNYICLSSPPFPSLAQCFHLFRKKNGSFLYYASSPLLLVLDSLHLETSLDLDEQAAPVNRDNARQQTQWLTCLVTGLSEASWYGRDRTPPTD